MKKFLALLFCFSTSSAYASNSAEFPVDKSAALRSPNGRYAIINVGQAVDSHHKLLFKSSSDSSGKPFYSYDRIAQVRWSPDSKFFVVNDQQCSNVFATFVFRVTNLSKPIDLGAKLVGSIHAQKDKLSMTENDHIYFDVRKWIDPNTLQLYVFGHGKIDPTGFTLIYEYSLKNGSFKRIKRLATET